jgi:hypothetical protein
VGWRAAGCLGANCFTVIVLIVFVCCCCHVGCLLPIAGGVLIVMILVHCVVAMWGVSCLLQEGIRGENKQSGEKKEEKREKREEQVPPSEKPMLIRRGADKKGKKNKKRGT